MTLFRDNIYTYGGISSDGSSPITCSVLRLEFLKQIAIRTHAIYLHQRELTFVAESSLASHTAKLLDEETFSDCSVCVAL